MTDPSDLDVGIDAEEWLRQRGVQRHVLTAAPAPDGDVARTDVSVKEAVRLATESPASEFPVTNDPVHGAVEETLADEIARAMTYVRRATASTPLSEGRLRAKLADRDFSTTAIDRAIDRARRERHVDDVALARALAEEGRAKGHAPARLRRDLRRRELPDNVIDAALQQVTPTDLEAAAFDVAQRKARACGDATAEAAFRRVVGHLARRGYPEDLARRVARQAVFDDREPDRIASR